MPSGPPMEPADGQLLHHLGVLRPPVRTRQRDDRDLPARCRRTARAGAGMRSRRSASYPRPGWASTSTQELKGGRTLLRELITDDEFECYVPAGYPGQAGELWFVRLCPPVDPVEYHVAFTTPYILMDFGKADWTAYLSKSLIGLTAPEKRRRLHELMKYGREPDFWSEFIFKAYHHHRPDAIFLTGLPDVPGSLPHA